MPRWNRSVLTLLTALALAAPCGLRGQSHFAANPLPFARNLHGAAILREHLYVVSGDTPSGFTPSVQSARINHDRSLGTWVENRALPMNLIYLGNSVVADGQVLYVCGGQMVEDTGEIGVYHREDNNRVWFARAGEDGLLREWRASERWASSQSLGMAAISNGRYLFVTGGGMSHSDFVSRDCHYAPIDMRDGVVGPWRATSRLPVALWHHAIFRFEDRVYIAGGRTTSAPESVSDRIYTTTIGEDGSLAPWEELTERIVHPVSSAAACSSDSYLFLFCGMTRDNRVLERLQYAPIDDEGSLSEWKDTTTTINARYFAAAAFDSRRRAVYITGGRRTTDYRDLSREVYCYPLRDSATQGATDFQGFYSLDAGLMKATREESNILFYFHADQVEASRTLLASLRNSRQFFVALEPVVPIALEAGQYPQYVRRFQLVRFPAVVLVTPAGDVLRTQSGPMTQEDILALVRGD